MARINLKVKGVADIQKKFAAFGRDAEKQFEDITKIAALDIAADAKRLAPVDKGDLQQSIVSIEITKLIYQIAALSPYAAYQEFGTGFLTDVPAGLEELALQFKGDGIKEINIPPQPFLYPAFVLGKIQYIEDLTTALKRLTKQYG